jgi:hypothetical protein
MPERMPGDIPLLFVLLPGLDRNRRVEEKVGNPEIAFPFFFPFSRALVTGVYFIASRSALSIIPRTFPGVIIVFLSLSFLVIRINDATSLMRIAWQRLR